MPPTAYLDAKHATELLTPGTAAPYFSTNTPYGRVVKLRGAILPTD
ncbi:MAG TPA: hypothetical protein VIQ97_04445 [Prevotella sp.]